MAACVCFGFTSCSDDDDENTSNREHHAAFYGEWVETVATAMSLITIRSIPTAKAYTVHTSLTSIG